MLEIFWKYWKYSAGVDPQWNEKWSKCSGDTLISRAMCNLIIFHHNFSWLCFLGIPIYFGEPYFYKLKKYLAICFIFINTVIYSYILCSMVLSIS